MLDAAEFRDAVIVASNDLDEYQIKALKEQGARVDIWGVGTRLVTAYDQPALGGVYKLSALRDSAGLWQHKVKRSEEAIKASTPGILQVRRYEQDDCFLGDVIYDELTGLSDRGIDDRGDSTPHSLPLGAQSRELLVPIYRAGKRVYRHPALTEMQGRARGQLDRLAVPEGADEGWPGYRVCLEEQLFLRRQRLIAAGSESGA
jgi:nicotinate phosphoribosyltransferase